MLSFVCVCVCVCVIHIYLASSCSPHPHAHPPSTPTAALSPFIPPPPVCLSACLPACLSVCLFVCLSVCPHFRAPSFPCLRSLSPCTLSVVLSLARACSHSRTLYCQELRRLSSEAAAHLFWLGLRIGTSDAPHPCYPSPSSPSSPSYPFIPPIPPAPNPPKTKTLPKPSSPTSPCNPCNANDISYLTDAVTVRWECLGW